MENDAHDEQPAVGVSPDQMNPAWIKDARYILSDQWVINRLKRHPHLFDDIRLDQLQPDLFPADRVLARIAIIRDRIKGIEHPELETKLSARL